MNIIETESDTAQEDTGGAEVVSSSAVSASVDESCQRYSKHVGQSLATLDVSPGSGEVPRSHLLEDKHLESVVVSSTEDAVNPNKRHVSIVTLQSNMSLRCVRIINHQQNE